MLESTFDKLVARHLDALTDRKTARANWLALRDKAVGITCTDGPSGDQKLGGLYATYRLVGFDHESGGTCDKAACLFARDGLCYAMGGFVDMAASRSAARETDGWVVFWWLVGRVPVNALGVRFEVGGDTWEHLPNGTSRLDYAYLAGVLAGLIARPDLAGKTIRFTATWRSWPAWLVAKFKAAGHVINASIQRDAPDSDCEAARALGFTLATADDEIGVEKANVRLKGRKAVVCPEIRDRKLGKVSASKCATCMVCARDREGMTAFPTH